MIRQNNDANSVRSKASIVMEVRDSIEVGEIEPVINDFVARWQDLAKDLTPEEKEVLQEEMSNLSWAWESERSNFGFTELALLSLGYIGGKLGDKLLDRILDKLLDSLAKYVSMRFPGRITTKETSTSD